VGARGLPPEGPESGAEPQKFCVFPMASKLVVKVTKTQ